MAKIIRKLIARLKSEEKRTEEDILAMQNSNPYVQEDFVLSAMRVVRDRIQKKHPNLEIRTIMDFGENSDYWDQFPLTVFGVHGYRLVQKMPHEKGVMEQTLAHSYPFFENNWGRELVDIGEKNFWGKGSETFVVYGNEEVMKACEELRKKYSWFNIKEGEPYSPTILKKADIPKPAEKVTKDDERKFGFLKKGIADITRIMRRKEAFTLDYPVPANWQNFVEDINNFASQYGWNVEYEFEKASYDNAERLREYVKTLPEFERIPRLKFTPKLVERIPREVRNKYNPLTK